VVLIGRPQLVEAVERQGLRLETQTFDEHVRVSASTEGSAVQGAQLVLFCVKSTDTESGAAAIKPHLALDAVVLSLQNGGGFKIPWRDDRRSASRVVSVIQTTSMRLDYEIRSTVAGHRLQLRICMGKVHWRRLFLHNVTGSVVGSSIGFFIGFLVAYWFIKIL
jgi:ketopantoate reductase